MLVCHFYRPQRSCEGYVFTCVCMSTGGGAGGAWSRGGLVSQHALRQTPPPGRDGYCCGRYASYWTAFLSFFFVQSSVTATEVSVAGSNFAHRVKKSRRHQILNPTFPLFSLLLTLNALPLYCLTRRSCSCYYLQRCKAVSE